MVWVNQFPQKFWVFRTRQVLQWICVCLCASLFEFNLEQVVCCWSNIYIFYLFIIIILNYHIFYMLTCYVILLYNIDLQVLCFRSKLKFSLFKVHQYNISLKAPTESGPRTTWYSQRVRVHSRSISENRGNIIHGFVTLHKHTAASQRWCSLSANRSILLCLLINFQFYR